jgi:5S rRNA maturation endonuclease (ribonuclease M5)
MDGENNMSWNRVSRKKPCPICQSTDWCSVSGDGAVAICMREPSDRVCYTKRGEFNGWIHTINESIGRKICKIFTKNTEPRIKPEEWHLKMISYYSAMTLIDWVLITENLGIPSTPLARYFVGKYPCDRPAFTFPMWTGWGKLCGIRIRDFTGAKWSVKGSRNGLFIPAVLSGESPLIIVEGGTDAASLTALGFDTIGRFSCCGGLEDIKVFLRKNPYKRVIIMSDNDVAHYRQNGDVYFPGQDGAAKLSEQLGGLQVVKPPFKDMRAWYNKGVTRQDVLDLINVNI